MNRTLKVKVDENAPHSVVGAAVVVVDVTDVGWEEAGHYRVYCRKEIAVEEAVVECDMEIAHVNLVNDYSCKQHLHKEIAVLVDDDDVAAVVAVVADADAVVVVAVEE